NDEVIVGIEADGALLMIFCGLVIAAGKVQSRQDSMYIAIIIVQGECDSELLLDGFPGRVAIRAPIVNPGLAYDATPPGMCMCIVGVERQSTIYGLQGFDVVLSAGAMVQHLGGKYELVGSHAFRLIALDTLIGRSLDAAR